MRLYVFIAYIFTVSSIKTLYCAERPKNIQQPQEKLFDVHELSQRNTPTYCDDQTASDFSRNEECNEALTQSLPHIPKYVSKFSTHQNEENFIHDLRNYASSKLLLQKQAFLKIHPRLQGNNGVLPVTYRSADQRGRKLKSTRVNNDFRVEDEFNQCLNRAEFEATKEVSIAINEELKKPYNDEQLKNSQNEYLANLLFDSLLLESVFDDKVESDKQLKDLSERLEDADDEVRRKKNAVGYAKTRSGHRDRLLTKDQITERTIKAQEALDQAIKAKQDIKNEINKSVEQHQQVNAFFFSNPLLFNQTNIFEKNNFKKSKMQTTSIDLLKNITKKSNKDISGNDFINKSLTVLRNRSATANELAHIREQLYFVVTNDSELRDKLFKQSESSVAEQLNTMDETLAQICKNNGEDLHHSQRLVEELFANSHNNDYQKTHCALLEKSPMTDSNLALYGVIAAGMLASGIFAPIGFGLALTVGGLALSGVGLYDTIKLHDKYKVSQGLSLVSLEDQEVARRDLRVLRQSIGWNIADGILLPLDAVSLVAKSANSTGKVRYISEKPENYVDELSETKLPHYKTGKTYEHSARSKVFLSKKMLEKESHYISKKIKNDPLYLQLRNFKGEDYHSFRQIFDQLFSKYPSDTGLQHFDFVIKKYNGEHLDDFQLIKATDISEETVNPNRVLIKLNTSESSTHTIKLDVDSHFGADDQRVVIDQFKEMLQHFTRDEITELHHLKVYNAYAYAKNTRAHVSDEGILRTKLEMSFFAMTPTKHAFFDADSFKTFVHEMGHIMAKRYFGSYTPPGYKDVIRLDKKTVSSYGNTASEEDFAETLALYFNLRINFKNEGNAIADFPFDMKELDPFVRYEKSLDLHKQFSIGRLDSGLLSAAEIREAYYHRFRYLDELFAKDPELRKTFVAKLATYQNGILTFGLGTSVLGGATTYFLIEKN